MRKKVCFLLASGLLALPAVGFLAAREAAGLLKTAADAQEPKPKADKDAHTADRTAIRKTMQSFTEAFEKGDAAAAVAYLTSGAELIPDDAEPVRGRDAIQAAFTAHFAKKPRTKITLDVASVHFPSRDTAVEEGEIKVAPEKGDPATNRYSALYVREDGKWLLAQIREWPSEQAELRDLDWLIGSWSAKRLEAEVQTTYEWFGNKSFIRAHFTVREKDKTFTGMQLIGTDSRTGELRTWMFEFDGGFGEGTCTRDGQKWVFESTTTMPDGGVLTANNILVNVDNDTFTWQPVNLTVDGEQIADLPPVKVTRVKTKK